MKVIGVISGADKRSDQYIARYLDAYHGKFISKVSYAYASDMKKEDYVIEKDALYHFRGLVRSPLIKKFMV
jgi:hypothetical protein